LDHAARIRENRTKPVTDPPEADRFDDLVEGLLALLLADLEQHLPANVTTTAARGMRQLRLTAFRASDQIRRFQGVVSATRALVMLRFLLDW
jgi:hypothetical protein